VLCCVVVCTPEFSTTKQGARILDGWCLPVASVTHHHQHIIIYLLWAEVLSPSIILI
jgi:hydrogenase maturation factor HypF (carbamoyltransferase family)